MVRNLLFAAIIPLAPAIISGCSGTQPLVNPSGAALQNRVTAGYTSLYSFGNRASDGQQPKAGLIDVNGTLYGTTYGGGADGDGTVFSISATGTEKVLYTFQGAKDGANPSASLTNAKGVMYGTTEHGGGVNAGTVFRIGRGDKEKVLHTFGPVPDGLFPVASLIDVQGILYGTTVGGGDDSVCFDSCGTVYSISKGGKEKVLHSFEAYFDGVSPASNLLDVKGTLYGTTQNGIGTGGEGTGLGTVFTISTIGMESVLYSFPYGASDGADPAAGLIDVNGTLYGTTAGGGTYGNGTYGTAFSIATSGSLTSLHSFGDLTGPDGSRPVAPLLNVKGKLYGTTPSGGALGKGTIFSMSFTGADEKVLHSFGNGSDGSTPLAGLVKVKETLYGTTSAGGTYGEGTVFSLTP